MAPENAAQEIPEVIPEEQVEEIYPEAEEEGAPRTIDPAFVYMGGCPICPMYTRPNPF